jgi:hypothetical protein
MGEGLTSMILDVGSGSAGYTAAHSRGEREMNINMVSRSVCTSFLAFLVLSMCAASSLISPSFQVASAATSVTLAETLNSVVSNVNWTYGDSWTTNWALILAGRGGEAFDEAITADVARGNFLDALYVARLAELSGYFSENVSDATRTVLEQMQMCGSLPLTANAHGFGDPDVLNSGCYLVYHRFALEGYEFAKQYGLDSKWNATQAFVDFAHAYDDRPTGTVSGEMLWCDPQEDWAYSYTSRYYDEHAETLSVFLKFAEQGVSGAMDYADSAWSGVQAHWNSIDGYYGYTSTSTVECEMGNFAQIISEYQEQRGGSLSFWDRVIQDLNYKLLAEGWSSPGWGCPGVLRHATSNSQLRLQETMGAVIALQSLFPDFTSAMKTAWADMLMGSSPAWQGLIESSLNQDGLFCGVSPGGTVSNDDTACAAATLFLYGIVPVTGSLDIPRIEECYDDLRTPFAASDFRFDYANKIIRIPVHAGTLTFIFGAEPVSYTFPTDGVYTIKFADDWNSIEAVNNQEVQLVVRGSNNGIYCRAHNSSEESWGAWMGLPGSTHESPAAFAVGDKLHLSVQGINAGQIWHGYINLVDDSFSGWTLLSGSTPSAPTLTGNITHLCLVVRGNNNAIFYRFYDVASETWSSWASVPTGATLDSPAVTLQDNTLHIVVRGMNYDQIWFSSINLTDSMFSGWTLLDGATPSAPTLVSNSTTLCLVVRGENNAIYYRFYDVFSETWAEWNNVPTGATLDSPAAAFTGDSLQIAVRGMNSDQLWHSSLNFSTSTWSDWALLDGSTPSKPTLTS